MPVFMPRFLGVIAYLVALTVFGAVGYVVIEGWPWRDALHMTVITLTAVGFQEVRPLSELGRDFTMVLVAAGITGLGVWFALITSFILEFDLGNVRKSRGFDRDRKVLRAIRGATCSGRLRGLC